MKKKAFTLIELLAIIIVLTSIFALIVPEINKALTNRKNKEFKELSTSIENAAKLFVSSNYDIGVDTIPNYLTLHDLTENNMLDSPIIDPRNGNEFDPDTIITIQQDEDGVLIYKFDDANLVPTIETATIESNNSLNNKYAKNGNTVTLSIKFNKTIVNTPTITIGGMPTVVTGSGNVRTATYTIPSNESTLVEGPLSISISNYLDSSGASGMSSSTITSGGTVIYDRTPPKLITNFYIGGVGNPTYVINRNTILSSSVTGATQMCISTTTTCSTWETYASSKAYTLSAGDGTKTLYVWYRDTAGNSIGYYTDSVVLDTTPPTIAYFYIGGTGNPSYVTSASTTLYSSTSEATEMCINTVSTSCDTWQAYSDSLSYTLTSSEGTKTLYAWYRDAAGNRTTVVSDSVILDISGPTITGATIVSNYTPNNKLARNGSILTLNITFSEGITNTPTITIGEKTPTISGSGTTRTAVYEIPSNESSMLEGSIPISISNYIDVAGRVGNLTTTLTSGGTVTYDRTPPVCASSGGSSTWTNGSITLTGTCSDTGTGCVGNVTKSYTTNIDSTTESPGTVSDNVGNSTTCAANQTVKIDKSAPTCASSGGSGSWTNGNITLTGTCSDTGGSGCVGNVTKSYTSNTNSTTESPGTVSDNAGNSTTCSANQTVKIDKSAPSCASSGGSTSWTNGNITLTGTCSDTGGSGCVGNVTKSYTSNTSSTTESPGTVSDNAGNSTTCAANQTVRIDKTVPTCSTNGSSTWYNTSRTITVTCSDTGGSGLALCGSISTSPAYQTFSSNTNTTQYYNVRDAAGNASTCGAVVKIDMTAPSAPSISGTTTKTVTCGSDTGGSGNNSSSCLRVCVNSVNCTPSQTQASGYSLYSASGAILCAKTVDVAGNSSSTTCSAY